MADCEHRGCAGRRVCRSGQRRSYREANREKDLARKRAYHEANREKELARNRAYREANLEQVRASRRAWYYRSGWLERLNRRVDEAVASLDPRLHELVGETPA